MSQHCGVTLRLNSPTGDYLTAWVESVEVRINLNDEHREALFDGVLKAATEEGEIAVLLDSSNGLAVAVA